MQYLLLVYIDEALQQALPEGEFERRMRHCIERADDLKAGGTLLDSRQLEEPRTAKSVRRRNGKVSVVDGPFAETKEILAGFNLIEAESPEQALELAAQFPWAETGCIEVRAVRDLDAMRERVGAAPAAA